MINLRTKNQLRGSRYKGSNFEYKTKESIEQSLTLEENSFVYLTKELGFKDQYDIGIKKHNLLALAIECKNHIKIPWQKRINYLNKLKSKTPKEILCMLIFKEKYKPVFCMMEDNTGMPVMFTFEDYFKVKFKRYKNAKKNNKAKV